MRYQLRTVFASVISGALLLLGGCFPSDDDNGGSNPATPTTLPETVPNHTDDPTVMPVNINPAANTTEAGIDSMFTQLINRTKKLDSISSPSELYAIDFTSLRSGFGAAITKSPNHVKANIGFIVSSVLSINGSRDLQKIVDSMDRYIDDMDTYYSSADMLSKKSSLKKTKFIKNGLLSRTFAKHGILSTGQALIAETPKVLLAQTSQMPSFPKFITVSYIQDAIEANVLPRLNEVLGATQRLRAINGMNLPVTIDDGETYEIDVSDILVLEASLRAARAGFSMMLVYDMDIYNPDGTTSPKWIDSIQSIYNSDDEQSSSELKYSLCGDTLLETYYYDLTLNSSFLYDLYSYNYSRSGFLSVKKNYFSAVYSDLKEIPVLLKAAIASINSETDLQDDDVLPAVKISDITEEMSSFSSELLEEGLSPSFASKFQSPSNLMDFITLILAQPYTFDEKIDGKNVRITVDISKFFTNPAASLKDYWPKYRIPTGNDRFGTYVVDLSTSSYNSNQFSVYDYNYSKLTVDIPSALIDSIDKDSSLSYVYSDYYLKNIIKYRTYKDSVKTFVAIQYLDNNNKPIDYYQYLYNDSFTLQDLNQVFPYFNDYTLRGIFPEMKTRQNWIDFFGVFID